MFVVFLFAAFVHSFGNKDDPEPQNYSVKRISNRRSEATFNYTPGKTAMFRDSTVFVKNWFDGPHTASTRVTRGTDVKTVEVSVVERKPDYTTVYWSLTRNFWTNPIFDIVFYIAMRVTLNEDRLILESIDTSAKNIFHSKYDKLQLFYRQFLKSLNHTDIP